MIRDVTIDNANAICQIYNHYIENTTVTFEEEPVSVEVMQDRIYQVTQTYPWVVFDEEGTIVGYAYASRWHSRSAYRFSVESTVYVSQDMTGQGVGNQLYQELIARLKSQSVHTVIGGITLPNPASVALHEKLGFKQAAHYQQVGWKFGQWIDVGYWELILSNLKPTSQGDVDVN
jgi:L-amino acid N-acyltransferase YncA